MGNMAYCRFENTVKDMQDCIDHLDEQINSTVEERARDKFVKLCHTVVEDYDQQPSKTPWIDRAMLNHHSKKEARHDLHFV